MRTSINKLMLGAASLAVTMLGAAGPAAAANPLTTINLTAQRTSAVMPDGASVPMWGYCGGLAGTTNAGTTVGGACGTTWAQGPTIVIPANSDLTISLTNMLPVPTSVTILGQIGGGLGSPARDAAAFIHPPVNSTTWPVTASGTFTPPPQPVLRANSFVPVAAAGKTGTYSWTNLKPGTYLYETGTRPSLQAPMGLYGVLVVTTSPVTDTALTTITVPGLAFPAGAINGVVVPAVAYDADAAFLISEVDAVQNAAVDAAATNPGFQGETAKWTPSCGANSTCYPPAVNYAPTYLLLNGKPFDRDNPGGNAVLPQILGIPSGTLYSSGKMMLRVANAGLRTHVPSLVGMTLQQVAEDGNRAPGAPQTVSELLMTAGKTRDVLIAPPTVTSVTSTGTSVTTYTEAAYGFFDRSLGLSTNNRPNGGAQGYLAIVNPSTLSNLASTTITTTGAEINAWLGTSGGKSVAVMATANPDSFQVSTYLQSYTNNVLTNDVGIYGAVVTTPPKYGTVTMSADGTFVYTTAAAPFAGDSFVYCGNGAPANTPGLCATVTLAASNTAAPIVTANDDTYASNVSTLFRAWGGEGVLANDTDNLGYPLHANFTSSEPTGCATLNADGSFIATSANGDDCVFTYTAQDSQGVTSAPAKVRVFFQPQGSSPQANFVSAPTITVVDALGLQQGTVGTGAAAAPTAALTDYMWVIEEDPTFHTVPGVTPPANGAIPALTISNSFHVSHTPIVAAGCTGPLSCGDAQTYGSKATSALPRSLPSDVWLDPTKHYFISVLPGDAANAFVAGIAGDPTVPGNCTFSNVGTPSKTDCGHTIGGAQIPAACVPQPGDTCNASFAPVTVYVDPNPLKPSQLSIIAFEDNNPINGDLDDGEAGLGGFNVVIFDAAGRSGDPAGQITYDAFNMPLTNWLLGKPGCPNEENPTVQNDVNLTAAQKNSLVGAIYTCPDGHRNIVKIRVRDNETGEKASDTETNEVVNAVVTTATPHGFTRGTAVDISGVVGSALFNGTFTVTRVISPTKFRITAPAGYTGPLSIAVTKGASVRDPAKYSLAGHALVKNIMPGRFDVLMHPNAQRDGDGETWYQVSTLEGTPANDAFARAGEPAYFQEFGPPGYHAFVGWMNPDRIQTMNTLMGNGNTITGRVTNLHMSRPAQIFNYDSATRDPLKNSVCFVGLNTGGGNGASAGFAKCDDQGNFTLTNVPYGSHQVVVWDQWLDQIIAYFNVNIPASTAPVTVSMGDMPVFSWFTLVQENAFVYNDDACARTAITGAKDQASLQTALNACPQTPLAQIPITVRFRDGSISNKLLTDTNGNATFNELFPLFNWYVVEVDQTRYAPLTAHVVVDGGGKPDCTTQALTGNGTTTPVTYSSSLTAGCTSPGGLAPGAITSTYPDGTSTEHTYTAGELYFGLQGFISETQRIDWGKTVLPPGQNGGFSGLVVYASTRGFDDPSLEVQFLWEPLVPRVPVYLYQKKTAPDGTVTLLRVARTTTTSWDDIANGTYTDFINNPLGIAKPSCPGQVASDPYVPQSLGTDLTRCYDGFHNWNQVQPEAYDGYYQFPTMYPSGVNADGSPVNPAEKPVAIIDGQYVIEIVPPAGYEVVKEEDKNILIGDAWVAPPAQQFATLSNIFILPDQATVSSAYNLTGPSALQSRLGFVEGKTQLPLCAGAPHRVPDFLSLFPNSKQIAPFAGADRPLCDRKEVSIVAGQNGSANFFVFSNTPRASKFTGIILDDASAEFNVAAPDFGEKFGVPYVAVSIKDQYGFEIERVYGDQWGGYNGMTPSTWQVNVPNPAGYSPSMLVTCMNDPGPITDPVTGAKVIDPNYMPYYSNFCYTNPFMPGLTTYLDTPVLPVGAFASNYVSGYNPVDCAYPDATPAVSRVDGAGIGPWITPAARTLTIKALGTVQVPNPAYLGPVATSGPSSQKMMSRTYNFAGAPGKVTLTPSGGGTPIDISVGAQWSATLIIASVPTSVPPGAYELGITNANGNASVDTVTVTVLGANDPAPTILTAPSNSVTVGGTSHIVQNAIDAASPGDLIILDAGVYNELVVMWKPVRLQGVGAVSVVINAAKYPTDKLETWRPTINQKFGVDTISGNASSNPQVDPLPGQEITGGIVFLEPSVLATEEGAGVTVLAKNQGNANCSTANSSALSNYYDSTKVITVNGVQQGTLVTSAHHIGESWFACAPSRIDGISVTGGDAGGGIYVNGYAHGIEIANNRVYGNAGAFGGGIRVGVPHLETQDLPTIQSGFNNNVKVHHNAITQNGLIEASGAVGGTPGASGAGAGLALCTGTNNYLANYNFVCGNYSSSDGGGIGHIGWSSNGTIAKNTILFNQSFFQQSATNGGGVAIEGDAPAAGALSLGVGSVTLDSNLIQGNFAQAGHGGGVALIQVNGSDTTGCGTSGGCKYANSVSVTNNMIVDNVAGWSAGGLYLADSFNVSVVNNTVAMNDSVGIAGPLFKGGNFGTPNPAGISADATSPALATLGVPAYSYPTQLANNIVWHNRSFYASLSGTLTPPNNVGLQGTAAPWYPTSQLCASNNAATVNQGCATLSTALAAGQTALTTLATGQCDPAHETYWDLGLVGDNSATPGVNRLQPTYSVLTDATKYAGAGNLQVDPGLIKSYCNSSQTISASSDEMGNFVDFRYGPLSQTAPVAFAGTVAGGVFGDYGILTTSPAIDAGTAAGAPNHDIYATPRPQGAGFDIGAMEVVATAAGSGSVAFTKANLGTLTPSGSNATLAFGNLSGGQNSTVTLSVSGSAVTFGRLSLANTLGSAFSVRTDNCSGKVLAPGGSCTVQIHFAAPGGSSQRTATLTVPDSANPSPQLLYLTGS